MKYLLFYLLIINAVSCYLMYADKKRAKNHRWRIRESTLFLSSFLGGSIGSLLGMYWFRHKTKHLSFRLGMPAILLFHLFLAGVLLFRL